MIYNDAELRKVAHEVYCFVASFTPLQCQVRNCCRHIFEKIRGEDVKKFISKANLNKAEFEKDFIQKLVEAYSGDLGLKESIDTLLSLRSGFPKNSEGDNDNSRREDIFEKDRRHATKEDHSRDASTDDHSSPFSLQGDATQSSFNFGGNIKSNQFMGRDQVNYEKSSQATLETSGYLNLNIFFSTKNQDAFTAVASASGSSVHEDFKPTIKPKDYHELIKEIRRVALDLDLDDNSNATLNHPIAENLSIGQAMRKIGEQMYQSLFHGAIKEKFVALMQEAKDKRRKGVRVVFIFDIKNKNAAALRDLPWEWLYDGGFLSDSSRTPIVRSTPEAGAKPCFKPGKPLRVLLYAPQLDSAFKKELDELKQMKNLALDCVVEKSWAKLRMKFFRNKWDVFHLMAHGRESFCGDSLIQIRTESGDMTWIDSQNLAASLEDDGNLPKGTLATLTVCSSAYNDLSGDFVNQGTGEEFLNAGFSAVVSMRHEISGGTALTFSTGFFPALAAGSSVESAVAKARAALFTNYATRAYWAAPVLFA